ncbi:MAG: retention module-containing protein, partial [Chromatiales bacterium]|nr:retention module-containing protein [Chromatiales bacterium]
MTSTNAIGAVEQLVGSAQVRGVEGTIRVLAVGDKVYEGEILITNDTTSIIITFYSGAKVEVGSNTEVLLDESVHRTTSYDISEMISDVETMQLAIANGADLADLEAPSAGPAQLDTTRSLKHSSIYERVGNEGEVETGNTQYSYDEAQSTFTTPVALTPLPQNTNSPTTLTPDTHAVIEDSVASGNVLANDSDVDDVLTVATFTVSGDPSTYNGGDTVAITGGSLTLNADGSYTFTPTTNWNGTVPQVSYTTNTGSTSTLDITVSPVNDPSILAPDTNTVAEDTPAVGNVLSNDSDVDDVLT